MPAAGAGVSPDPDLRLSQYSMTGSTDSEPRSLAVTAVPAAGGERSRPTVKVTRHPDS